ncbi:GlxA family transcriptional regulator [Gloeobacter kilaueensis]|uniref:AraC family transcriptional regulator n=1 Tax=Gloeobacter kilaueensis (strain ATCC BAA-2537 / CCAP 1431/1 / ULC 316 / JS1) TaxID=1183438 RepID=U5QQ25_GLOK1|nr:helix-turn-helix domain-containing protein [Gloeobacter kilaueensis]AGY59734.1 AraC family transcriptional regulator [Gloeobacter kilaueensis JS1]
MDKFLTGNPVSPDGPPRRIVFLVLDRVHLLDLAGPAQVFDIALALGANYTLQFCAVHEQVRSAQGLWLGRLEALPSVGERDSVIVAGVAGELKARLGGEQPVLPPDARRWLQQAYAAGARVASVCGGALALAEAGLLDGRHCTTHWKLVGLLEQRYPRARVLDGVLYVHDGSVTTSAGIASGIDMALSLVEREHGPRFAAEIARLMVVYLRRNGSATQASAFLEHRTHLHPNVHRAQDWLAEHAAESVTLARLAAVAGMSVRHFSRAFKDATGITPRQYQQRLRLEVAAHLLAEPGLSVEEVASRCGFEDPRHFRRLWGRHFGAAPSRARPASHMHPA